MKSTDDLLLIIRLVSLKLAFYFQIILLYLCNIYFRTLSFQSKPIEDKTWILGVEETAGVLFHSKSVFKNHITVCLYPTHFYEFHYDYMVKRSFSKLLRILISFLWGPFLLAKFANRYNNFLYIGSKGFLVNTVDGRFFEFSFLDRKKKNINCMFLGSDIRSPLKILNFCKLKNLHHFSSLQYKSVSPRDLVRVDLSVYKLAVSSNIYANKKINSKVDQLSYLDENTLTFEYYISNQYFRYNMNKFENTSKPIILHSPSNELIKGTSYIRNAISHLKELGYEFDYREFSNIKHEDLRFQLLDSHIVINELLSFAPGFFTIEAMASSCITLSSPVTYMETITNLNGKVPWIGISSQNLLIKLRELLDCKDIWRNIAEKQFRWAQNHVNTDSIGSKIYSKFDKG